MTNESVVNILNISTNLYRYYATTDPHSFDTVNEVMDQYMSDNFLNPSRPPTAQQLQRPGSSINRGLKSRRFDAELEFYSEREIDAEGSDEDDSSSDDNSGFDDVEEAVAESVEKTDSSTSNCAKDVKISSDHPSSGYFLESRLPDGISEEGTKVGHRLPEDEVVRAPQVGEKVQAKPAKITIVSNDSGKSRFEEAAAKAGGMSQQGFAEKLAEMAGCQVDTTAQSEATGKSAQESGIKKSPTTVEKAILSPKKQVALDAATSTEKVKNIQKAAKVKGKDASTAADSGSESDSDDETGLVSVMNEHEALMLYKKFVVGEREKKAKSGAKASRKLAEKIPNDLNKLELNDEELAYFGEWKKEHGAKQDKTFKKFLKFCREKPECMLRFVTVEYKNCKDSGTDSDINSPSRASLDSDEQKTETLSKCPDPLWFHTEGQILTESDETSKSNSLSGPPRCRNCGSKREFEFQFLPSLISLKKTHHEFGTVAFFTCANNCVPCADGNQPAYLEEYCYVQHEPEGN